MLIVAYCATAGPGPFYRASHRDVISPAWVNASKELKVNLTES